MVGEIRDYFDDKENVNILVRNQEDFDLLMNILRIYVKRYAMEIIRSTNAGFTVVFLEMSTNRLNALLKNLHKTDRDLREMSRKGLVSEMVSCVQVL